jgi:hypothetical protein
MMAAAGFAAAALLPRPARAMINPNYTPVDLARRASAIVSLELSAPATGRVAAAVCKTLKGSPPPAAPALAVKPGDGAAGDALDALLRRGRPAQALMFLGDFSAATRTEGRPAAVPARDGAMLVETTWFELLADSAGSRLLASDTLDLKAVWAGSAAMLSRAVEYAIADQWAEMPVRAGTTWAACVRVGSVPGASDCQFVGPDAPGVFVPSEQGDRLFSGTGPRKFRDATADTGLQTRSRLAAWTDADGDGRADLASWDGQAVRVHRMTPEGKLGAAGEAKPLTECFSLCAADAGGARSALLCGTPAGVTVLLPEGPAQLRAVVLDAAAAGGRGGGPAVAADLDGDGLVDVAQCDAGGLLVFRGRRPGEFESARRAASAELRGRPAGLFAADADGDGLLDLVAAGAEGPALFWNLGDGTFREVVEEGGELPYIAKPDAAGGAVCDFNADGRQDLLLIYEGMEPQAFFNRGFRCFGYAMQLEPDEERLPDAGPLLDGQRGVAVADCDGDGAQDAALAAAGGEICVLFGTPAGDARPSLTVRVRGSAGPVTVTASDDARCLGAQSAAPGRPAFFGRRDAGPLTVTWRFPGATGSRKRVDVLKPQTLVIAPDMP